MDKLILYAFIIFTLGILYKIASALIETSSEGRLPYKKKEFFLNASERKLFEFLQVALPKKYLVLPQVVMSSILNSPGSGKEFYKYQNKINRKILDFVIFEKNNLVPILAIEYDGPTHDRENRIQRDKFVDSVLESAGIDIVHIRSQQFLDLENIGKEINDRLP